MVAPNEVLEKLYQEASASPDSARTTDSKLLTSIEYVCRCPGNRAGVRLLMACMLGKIDKPHVDPRCPYTEIGGENTFSGRSYDEAFVTNFINTYKLPCNSTTAFLTPALRNINRPLTIDLTIAGRPSRMYSDSLQVLDAVASGSAAADEVLYEIVRFLILMREENAARLEKLLVGAQQETEGLPLEQFTNAFAHSRSAGTSFLHPSA
jgi:hypothetical protein